ncbi:FecR/PupR family sigma factor regulator [Bordetella bronchiseptica]|uniref:FecR/PupR family sigma factor regulator n=1 Tax=Bordetella bronchiseptica TaxID=518 RepID=UPI0002EA436E|nr:DUF4880 domain-containing protein [Bordetella bronchiseptica]KAK68097.1 hypothetical protein AZ22_1901 [Bordetella bronchiseptica 980-2]KCV29185.1 hypothetical protein L489_2068 [Bordetella bronchiseptica 00-P-2730]KDD57725.1 hypothetical protein L533_2015 [Bordetella bronchiseptica OSU553]AMG88252.1 DUF4880 domain-containing protein [Bordetella bronchiseptica]KAB1445667.1 DUF4880 domain-containing protein [Bordetella bronchiseptica]
MTDGAIDPSILREAAAWLARAQDGPLDSRQQAAFEAWRVRSAMHQRAWRRAERLAGQLESLRPGPGATDARGR